VRKNRTSCGFGRRGDGGGAAQFWLVSTPSLAARAPVGQHLANAISVE
jgi:hypothetical protein